MTDDETCLWCGRPSTRLCDTILHTDVVLNRIDALGRPREPKRRLLPIGSLDDTPTCDAPICSRCATSSTMFDVKPSSYDDRTYTIDRCPYCVTQGHVAHLQAEAVAHRERCRAHGEAALARHLAKPDATILRFEREARP